MDNPSSLTFFLFCFCWVALIAGAVLGYIIGIRMARNRERPPELTSIRRQS